MKKRITKTLSVILALIMLVSSTSVSGMGILSFAIDEFNEIDNLLASNEASDVRTELDSRTDTDDTRTDTDTGDDQVYEGTCGAEGDNLKWSFDSVTGELKITGSGDMYDYDSPWDSYTDLIKTVTIENGVTSIGSCAFMGCSSLESITIPDSVTSIGNQAFMYCSLKSVEIGSNVESIGYIAFSDCKSLSITVDDNNDYYSSDSYGVLYNKDKTTLIQYPIGNTRTSFVIPDSVTIIGGYAFRSCDSLKSITILDSVTSIGDQAFANCDNLQSVEIGSSVKSIGDSAFFMCDSLKSITIPDSVTSIGSGAFEYCGSLESVKIGSGVTSIGNWAFDDCDSLESITIPDSVTSIGDGAFESCGSLESVEIGSGVTSIGEGAFMWCTTLKNITIPDSVTSIGNSTFANCDNLQRVEIGNSVTSIGESAFFRCSSLESITIPSSVTSIGESAFFRCSSLESITIPSSVTSIGESAFEECDSLESITILNPECEIGDTEYTFPEETVIHGYVNSTAQKYADKYGRQFVEHTHTPREAVKENEIAATCSATGSYDMVVYCDVCEEEISRVTYTIDKLPHTFTTYTSNNDATCIEDGTKTAVCDVCKVATETITDEGSHLTAEHKYTNYVSDGNATCTEDGTKTAVCDVCHDAKDTIADEGSKLDHTPGEIARENVVEATCTKDGSYEEVVYCSVCQAELSRETKTTDKLPHTESEWIIDDGYDCAKGGTKHTECTVCGEKMNTETISAKEHNYVKTVTPAACTQQGYTTYTCSECKNTYTADIVAPLGHSKDNGTVTKAATCTAAGTRTYKCSRCGEIINTETIPAAGHKSVVVKGKAATCTKTGLTDGSKCSVCGTVLTAQKTVAKKAHTYKNVVTKATLTKNGKIVPTCSVCKATKTATTVYYPKTIKLSATSATYTGKAIKPKVTVTDSKGKTVSSSNYTVSYKNNTKVGTATVTVTFKGNYSGTKKLTFKIVPGQVKNLKASKVTTTAVKLAWSKVTGAKYYKIEQSTDGKKWKTVKTTDKTTYTVSKLKTGAKYRFRVTALDSTKKIAGKASSVLKTGTKTAAPKVTLKSTKSKTATASWKKVTGASKYIVYKSTNNKKWTKVGSTTKLSYKLSKLSGGKKIYVKVIAVNAYKQNSAYSKAASVTVKK